MSTLETQRDSQSCASCYHFIHQRDDKPIGECHRNAPQAALIASQRQTPLGMVLEMAKHSFWPDAKPTEWCAQWRSKRDFVWGENA